MITILPAGINEVDIIHTLAHRIWPVVYKEILTAGQMKYMLNLIYSHDSLKKQMQTPGRSFIIAYDHNEPVGFAAFFPKHNNTTGIYHLDKLYVLPDQHGKGIGKKLLNHIISLIKPLGCCVFDLNVNRYNKAISFYEKLGFKIVSEVDVPIGEGYFMNDYVMERSLTT